ncbi:hypothetical protein A9G11_09340 [Gilliamella sp. wkB108]|uniref:YiiX/YebB-like N1pC/P60 family cysteine hydrolase n=1 Tax=Gilliamella sp. wkB108 TaxID=3120256 RepID=UPI00080DFEAC|nr:YiiX/YebB-like N1pC/P60 family cysteine hydrolase [Gilliamella apicola]OCG21129.1 hypothetical protein A9G11_09340 [Gilliamella apicola]
MLKSNNLQCGDIIFQTVKQNNSFNGAVSRSGAAPNKDELTNSINHVGLYIGNNIIIEANQKKGVIKQPISDFLLDGKYHIVATIYNSKMIKNAVERVQNCLGLPYNHSFHPEAEGFYCSQLITYAFKTEDNSDYFQLYPMNFKDVTNQKIIPYWHNYYRSLKQSIPQGELGSHPQQLLRQTHLFKMIRLLSTQ